MKILKKISIILLSLCLCVPCFSMVAEAADGRISFTDPETAVGEMVEVKCVVKSTSGSLGNIEVKLTYDSSALRFDSGDGVTADGDGALTCTGSGGSEEATFNIKFQALKEGDTSVSVSSATIASSGGGTLTLDQGSSAVKIAEGDPSKITDGGNTSSADDIDVEVNGTAYKLSDNFAEADIPAGYTKTEIQFEGQARQMVAQEASGITLGYLLDGEGKGDFFLYNADNATFSPFEQINISDTTSIALLSEKAGGKLPKTFQEVTLTLNGKDFPAWQNTEKDGFYVVYAVNSSGDKGYYQYDDGEGTYQRYEAADTTEEKTDNSLMGKIGNFIDKHIQMMVLIVGLGALIVLILIIVLAVKLHNRNAELDDLYDEYGIDEEEEPEKNRPAVKDKSATRSGLKKKKEEDSFDDFEEDDFDEDDFEDASYDDDDFEDYEDDLIDEDDFEPYDDGALYDDSLDDDIDDLDDLLSESKTKKRGHMETDDMFKVDFIDLD
ncbi:cohesin domain-containing protein [[Clostridium] hylemonae]|nr:cohesin domain-containing protein [[Clostridium] hylemonae]QEK17188.1 hypothetical protein LAJLEIBI_01197 [[Clostridium] hylemonae DSM 15053]